MEMLFLEQSLDVKNAQLLGRPLILELFIEHIQDFSFLSLHVCIYVCY